MDLDEAIKIIKNSYVMSTKHCLDDENIQLKQAIETVLQELEDKDKEITKYQIYLTEDVIPKKKIEDKINLLENLQEEFPDNEEIRIEIISYKELLEE